jgi:hypothetical protein
MNTEEKIQTIKKYMQQKLCFGLKVEGSEICRYCPIATECAPLRVARLTYELQQLEVVVAKPEADAAYEARMEGMSKAKFEAMIDKALNRRAELETMIVKALGREAERKARVSDPTAPSEQQTTKGIEEKEKGRPRKTGKPPEQQATKVVKTKGTGRSRQAAKKVEQQVNQAAKKRVNNRPRKTAEKSEQQTAKIVKVKPKGRPRTAKEKSELVIAMAAKGMARQAIASVLGISLASIYRILKDNR